MLYGNSLNELMKGLEPLELMHQVKAIANSSFIKLIKTNVSSPIKAIGYTGCNIAMCSSLELRTSDKSIETSNDITVNTVNDFRKNKSTIKHFIMSIQMAYRSLLIQVLQ